MRMICLFLVMIIAIGMSTFEYQIGTSKLYGGWSGDNQPLPGGQYHQFSAFIPNLSDVAEYGGFYQHCTTGHFEYVDGEKGKHSFGSNMDTFGLAVKLLVLPNSEWFPYVVCEPRFTMYLGSFNQSGAFGLVSGEENNYKTSETVMGGSLGLALGGRWRPYGQIAFIYTHHALGPVDPESGPKNDVPLKATIFKGDMGFAIEAWLPER